MRQRYVSSLRQLTFDPTTAIVIYDSKLSRVVPGFRNWIARYTFAFPVAAGEKLKSLSSFENFAERVHRRAGQNVTRKWTVVVVGGGSVGDFGGFFASVYRRGLRLVHVPTTWLAAIDSSHGGKTALNLRGVKNQIGTFYPASETILVRQILTALPDANAVDATSEFAKIAIIDGRAWTRSMLQGQGRVVRVPQNRSAWLWKLLTQAIESKLRVVRRDPKEENGTRQLLNLGHTFGHVLEADRGFSHGRSVALGLLFALDASESLGALDSKRAEEFRAWLGVLGISREGRGRDRVARAKATRLLRGDKKREEGDAVWFVVIRRFGRVERRRVEVSQLIEIADVNGWLR